MYDAYITDGSDACESYDLVPKGVHKNRTKGVENKVGDILKLAVFRMCTMLGKIC